MDGKCDLAGPKSENIGLPFVFVCCFEGCGPDGSFASGGSGPFRGPKGDSFDLKWFVVIFVIRLPVRSEPNIVTLWVLCEPFPGRSVRISNYAPYPSRKHILRKIMKQSCRKVKN